MGVKFSKEGQKKFRALVNRYPERQAAMLPVLYLAEQEFGHICPEVEEYVARLLHVPAVKVHEVITFYTLLARRRRGKVHFQICHGLSCNLLGCDAIIAHLQEKLGITPGHTTADLTFEFSVVECLGSCETAPMMQLNDDYVDHLTTATLDRILESGSGDG